MSAISPGARCMVGWSVQINTGSCGENNDDNDDNNDNVVTGHMSGPVQHHLHLTRCLSNVTTT